MNDLKNSEFIHNLNWHFCFCFNKISTKCFPAWVVTVSKDYCLQKLLTCFPQQTHTKFTKKRSHFDFLLFTYFNQSWHQRGAPIECKVYWDQVNRSRTDLTSLLSSNKFKEQFHMLNLHFYCFIIFLFNVLLLSYVFQVFMGYPCTHIFYFF